MKNTNNNKHDSVYGCFVTTDEYGDNGVNIRVQPFLNGYMTIQNVPYIVQGNSHRGRLSPATMLALAQVTRFMQERGLSEFDLRDYSTLYRPAMSHIH